MRRYPVESSSIRSVGYDLTRQVLQVEFTGGGLYDYLDVPPEEALALLESDSPGRYLNRTIRPHHRYRAVRRAG